MRIRVNFAKTSAMRFTGHLDLFRTWERTIRRAGLPLAYSQGFNPHPKIALACALPLGFTSQAEVIDIWLEEDGDLGAVQAALEKAAPPGIQIQNIEEVDARLPALQTVVDSAEYEITLLEACTNLDKRLAELLESEILPRQRRGKDYDLRPLILSVERLENDPRSRFARMKAALAAREGATGRPEELLEALGIDPLAARVHRTKINFV
jgi:radical SAM-linked protein